MPINNLAELRAQYPELEAASDQDVVNQYAQETGQSSKIMSAYFGVGRQQEAAGSRGDFGRGLADVVSQYKGLGAATGALAADAAGATELRDELFGYYQEQMQDMQGNQRPQYEIDYLTSDEASFGDWVDAAQYYAGIGLGNLAGAILTGGIGGFAAKTAGKQLIKEASEEALKKIATRGTLTGIGVGAIGQEVGATYGQAGEERIREGGTLDDVNKARALGYGTLAGSLEFVGDLVLLGAGRFLPKGTGGALVDTLTSGGRVARTAKGAAGSALVEAPTEVGQTILEDLGAETEVNLASEEYRSKLLQAAFAGSMAGGAAGGVASFVRGGDQAQETPPPDDTGKLNLSERVVTPNVRLQDFLDEQLGVVREKTGYSQKYFDTWLGEVTGKTVDKDQLEQDLTIERELQRRGALGEAVDETAKGDTPETSPGLTPTQIIEQSTGVDRQPATSKAAVKKAVKDAYKTPAGIFVTNMDSENKWTEYELSMGDYLQWVAYTRYTQNKSPDAPNISFDLPFSANATLYAKAQDTAGNVIRQPINDPTVQQQVTDAALQELNSSIAKSQQQQNESKDLTAGSEQNIAEGQQQQQNESDDVTAGSEQNIADDQQQQNESDDVTTEDALLSKEFTDKLSKVESEVVTLLAELFANNRSDEVVSLSKKNTASSLSYTQIEKALAARGIKRSPKTIESAVKRVKKKLKEFTGVDLSDMLTELDRQGRRVEAYETPDIPQLGTEASTEELSDETGSLSIRQEGKGDFGADSGGGMVDDAADILEVELKQAAERLNIPAVEQAAREKYEATKSKTSKGWDSLKPEEKQAWAVQYQREQAAQAESEEAQKAVEESSRRVSATHQQLLDAFFAYPEAQQAVERFDSTAEQNPDEALRANKFATLSPADQQDFITAIAQAYDGGVAAINQAVDRVGREIFGRLKDERDATAAPRRAGQGDSPQRTAERQDEQSGAELSQQTGPEQQADAAVAEAKAAESNTAGKIKYKRRRIIANPENIGAKSAIFEAERPAQSVTLEQAEAVAARVKQNQKWKLNGWRLEVFPNWDSLPPYVQAATERDAVAGYQTIDRKTGELVAFVVADMHASELDVENTILHEVAGHVASSLAFGRDRYLAMLTVYNSIGSKQFAELAEKFGLTKLLKSYEADYFNDEIPYMLSRGMLMEEMIAYMQGNRVNSSLGRRIETLIKQIVGEFKQFLRRNFGIYKNTLQMGESELLVLMRQMERVLADPSQHIRFEMPDAAFDRTDRMMAMQQTMPSMNAVAEFGGLYGADIDQIIDDGDFSSIQDDLQEILLQAMMSGRYARTPQGEIVPKLDKWGVNPTTGMARRRSQSANKQSSSTWAGAIIDRVADAVDEALPGVLTNVQEVKLGIKTLEQLANEVENPKHQQPVRSYIDAVHKIQREATKFEAAGDVINRQWAALESSDAKTAEVLGGLMVDTTMEGYDPSVNNPSDAKQRALKNTYDNLSQDAKQLYVTVRDHYVKARQAKIQALNDAVLAAEAELSAAQNTSVKLEKLRGDLESMRKIDGPYFPLRRLGKYYAIGMSQELYDLEMRNRQAPLVGAEKARYRELRKNESSYIVRSFASEREARDASRAMSRKYAQTMYNKASTYFEGEANNVPDIEKIASYFEAAGWNSKALDNVKGVLAHMYADLLPTNSSVKAQMRRENIAGADRNMRQVFADSVIKDAHSLSRTLHGKEVNAALRSVRNMGGLGDMEGRLLSNEITERANLIFQSNTSPVVTSLLSFSYMAHLGMSPAYIMSNMAQVPMITAPWLFARHNVGMVGRELNRALKDTTKIIKANWSKEGWRMALDWTGHVNAGESAMLQELLERNKLEITMEHDLVDTAKGSGIGVFSRKSGLLQLVNTPVRIGELANRAITGLAAYRLELQRTGDKAKATEYALRAVNDTQLDYSGLNAPRYMQSILGSKSLARLMFQFRKYQQGMVNLVMVAINDALRSHDPQVRQESRRLLLGLFTTTSIMAGLVGTPLAGTLAFLINSAADLAGDDDEPFDVVIEMRNGLTDLWGADLAEAIMNGLPTMLAGVDLSKRVGMSDLLYPLPFARFDGTPRENVGETLIASLGAAPSYLVNVYEGLDKISEGEYAKGAEKVVPVKLLQNLIRALRYSAEGMTDTRGEPIIESKDFDGWDLLMRASGFSTTKESRYYEANNRMYELKNSVDEAKNDLLRRYAQAKLRRDIREVTAIRREIREFNERNRDRRVRITSRSLRSAVERRREDRAVRTEAGLRGGKAYRPYMEDVRFATEE